MTDTRRKALVDMIAIAVLVLTHGGLIVGLALAGEWRVWRFIANFVAQLDALILVTWFVWASLTGRREGRRLRALTGERQ